MKRFLTIVLMLCMCLAIGVFADEAKPVTVTLNGETVDCASYGQEATIVEGRTLVPLRAIFEALGASVEWNAETRTVDSKLGETEISLTIGENKLIKNGEEIALDVPAMIMNGRTLVPVRAVSESFGVNVEWDGEKRIVTLSEIADETEPDNAEENEEETLPKTKAYGKFFFGMSLEEAKAAAKGEVKQLKMTGAGAVNEVALRITDEENEFDDEDWLITGKLDCEKIELIFKNDILYSVTVTIEHQENLKDASEVYEKITDYYNLDEEIKNVFPKNWVEALRNEVDTSELLEDGELIEFPKRIEKYDYVNCFLCEKLDGGEKIGYYTSFDITNQWYYQYAMKQETKPEFADLLQKYPFGATKQQTINAFKGTIKLKENRIDIQNVQDQRRFVNDPTHRYYPEKDIYGQGFHCNYISIEYDDVGVDKFYARTEETISIDEATYSLNVILELYGEKKAVFHEDKNVYEWKNHKYTIYDGTEKAANIYAGIIQVDSGKYYCFVSAQQVKDGVNITLDEDGRITEAD